jgi:hypothetical protein
MHATRRDGELSRSETRVTIFTEALRDGVGDEEKNPGAMLHHRDLILDLQLVWKMDRQDTADLTVDVASIRILEKMCQRAVHHPVALYLNHQPGTGGDHDAAPPIDVRSGTSRRESADERILSMGTPLRVRERHALAEDLAAERVPNACRMRHAPTGTFQIARERVCGERPGARSSQTGGSQHAISFPNADQGRNGAAPSMDGGNQSAAEVTAVTEGEPR